MSEAQEPQIQPQAQAQASAQAQPQPGRPAAPAFAIEHTSSCSHGPLLPVPALVSSSNLPDPSTLDCRTPSQPSRALAENETHTQSSSTTHDQVQAHVKRPEQEDHQHQHQHPQRETPRPEEVGPETHTHTQTILLHGVTEAARRKDQEQNVNRPAANTTKSTLTTFASPPPVPAPSSATTTTVPATTSVPTDPTPLSSTPPSTSSLKPTLTPSGAQSEAHAQYQRHTHPGLRPLSPVSATAMSNPPHHPGHARPPVAFPSPTYGQQGLYGYGNPNGPTGDPYRGQPGGHQPMSLPSMRTFDPVQQQQAQQAPMAQQMMQVQAAMPGYYPHPVPLSGNPYSLPPDAMASRYALPPNDPRFLGNPRNKKEIKRRTKTGCLTCRKRRIKCDEQHPVCKNCQKSKRECMGYDPIFKQQQQHPTSIQPAPNSSHSAISASLPSNGPTLPSPSALSVPGSAATYGGSLPSVLPSSYNSGASSSSNTPVNTYEPSHSAPPTSIKSEHFEYGTVIDPSLDGVGAPPSTSTLHLPSVKSVAPIASPHPQRPPNDTLYLRGGGCPFVSHSTQPPTPLYQHWIPAYSDSSAKKMRVDELVGWGRSPAPKLRSFPDQAKLDEIRGLYDEIYAPGLESFFETGWFREETTSSRLMTQDSVLETVAGFLHVVGKTDPSNQAAMADSAGLEFRTVWDLTCLALTNESKVNPPSVIPADSDPTEARNRVTVFDALLSNAVMRDNPLVRPPPKGDYHRVRELDFWYHLGEFCRVEPLGYPPNPDIQSQRDQILNRIRSLLDGRENRDILYSIAVMRAFSSEYPADFESTLPQHLDEGDPRSKLAVARKFIQDEAKVTGGTTNVVRRFSDLAAMAFINPGLNVARHT